MSYVDDNISPMSMQWGISTEEAVKNVELLPVNHGIGYEPESEYENLLFKIKILNFIQVL